jgi:hypothetical protein
MLSPYAAAAADTPLPLQQDGNSLCRNYRIRLFTFMNSQFVLCVFIPIAEKNIV